MSASEDFVYSAAASREIDAQAIAGLGVSGYDLMNRAADAAFDVLLNYFPGVRTITVCCGKGNNAGDAYLVARRALAYGINTQVLAVVDPEGLNGDAASAYNEAAAAGLEVALQWHAGLISGEVIVDGLLGTGLSGPPREAFADAISAINGSGKPVLSIDIPSGVSADTGAVYECAVQATVTISFITRKIGLYTGAGISFAGLREFADLAVPDNMMTAPGNALLRWGARTLPALEVNTYKHRQGHVVVAGGDVSMPGAVAMAAEAALRVGAGMVTAVTRPQHAAPIVGRTPEVMVHGFNGHDADAVDVIGRADLVVLGPGLGRSAWSESLYRVVETSGKPTLVDADGLYWLAQRGAWHGGDLTLTPHVAEAARLLECVAQDIQADRCTASIELQKRYGCRGVLKGAGSVVFYGDPPRLGICVNGNPGMATAGMGDVLSGVTGGLLAAAANPDAADEQLVAGVTLHSAAGDAAAERLGERSLVATDVIAALPSLLKASARRTENTG